MYRILRTDKAEDQLREAIFYIVEDSGDIDVALTDGVPSSVEFVIRSIAPNSSR